jgi:hypothetical protein
VRDPYGRGETAAGKTADRLVRLVDAAIAALD